MFKRIQKAAKAEAIIKTFLLSSFTSKERKIVKEFCKEERGNAYDVAVSFMLQTFTMVPINDSTRGFVKKKMKIIRMLLSKCEYAGLINMEIKRIEGLYNITSDTEENKEKEEVIDKKEEVISEDKKNQIRNEILNKSLEELERETKENALKKNTENN